MNESSLVSVILPVYNGERYLAQAIESVLSQSYQPLELVVVDDGSTDSSAIIAQNYSGVRYFVQENAGVGAARNCGLKAAVGEFIAFQDADDIWLPGKLELQMRFLLDHPDMGYVISRIKFFIEEGFPVPAGFRTELLTNEPIGRFLQAMVARREVFTQVGNFALDLAFVDDVDWFARANDRGIQMSILPEVLLHKRVHDANISRQVEANNQNLLKALRRSVERKRNAQ